jgi:hypothetical protein
LTINGPTTAVKESDRAKNKRIKKLFPVIGIKSYVSLMIGGWVTIEKVSVNEGDGERDGCAQKFCRLGRGKEILEMIGMLSENRSTKRFHCRSFSLQIVGNDR